MNRLGVIVGFILISLGMVGIITVLNIQVFENSLEILLILLVKILIGIMLLPALAILILIGIMLTVS